MVTERDQQFLLPPNMRDWLPEDHLAWFVIDVVDQLDLDRFRSGYRSDGHGRAAYDPAMMVAVLLYAYCSGLRSSRVIERRCVEDIAFRVLAGGHCPDHVTIARFRQRHADALAAVLVDSLRLCAEAGLVRLGVVALDGTRMAANAARDANRTLGDLDDEVARMIAEADEIDRAEDNDDDDHLPPGLADRNGRLARLQAARQRLADTADERRQRFEDRTTALNQARAAKGLPPRTFTPRPRSEAPQPDARANTTDPDSRMLLARGGSLQGYNAQAVTTDGQIIVAAEVTQAINDVEQLEPMIDATNRTLEAAGIDRRPDALVADAGYWRADNVDGSIASPELFISVARASRRGKPRRNGAPSGAKSNHLIEAMNDRLSTERGQQLLRMRRTTIEPIFGQIKDGRGARRFSRRGLVAVQAEWQLLAATHNLLKLWRHRTATAG